MFDAVEHPTESIYHELHQSHKSSAGVDVSAPASATDRLLLRDCHTHRSVLATSTDVGVLSDYRAPGSGSLLAGYTDSCSSGDDQRARGCGGVPGTVRPQAVETW